MTRRRSLQSVARETKDRAGKRRPCCCSNAFGVLAAFAGFETAHQVEHTVAIGINKQAIAMLA